MTKSKKFQLMLSEAGYDALEQVADIEQRPLANVVRQALEEYVAKHGIKADFRVDRGGYRGRKTADDDSSQPD